jgi:hypothetical protein
MEIDGIAVAFDFVIAVGIEYDSNSFLDGIAVIIVG